MKRYLKPILIAFVVILLTAIGITITSNASATTPTSATLHAPHIGATNPGFQEGDCPSKGYGWHFVLTGNDTEFVSIGVDFENTATVTVFESHPSKKHAYVYTPGPDKLTGAVAHVNGPATKFVLSHICTPGSTRPTVTYTIPTPPTSEDDGSTTTTKDSYIPPETVDPEIGSAVSIVSEDVPVAQPKFTG